MKNTYKLLNHIEPLTEKKIRDLYTGYWVYIVQAKLTETGGLIEGIPVVIGSRPYAGVQDGIYEKYKKDEYAERYGMSLRHNRGFISSLRIIGDTNG